MFIFSEHLCNLAVNLEYLYNEIYSRPIDNVFIHTECTRK
jgi:hypothetical protein